MTAPRPHPELWNTLVHLLGLLRQLLAATAPEAFAAISAEARARLAHLTAMVRRYIHILAAEIILPPLQTAPAYPSVPAQVKCQRASRETFALLEHPPMPGQCHTPASERDPPELQWALLWEAALRLSAVLRDPARHARRLARYRQRGHAAPLRGLPVRWAVLRRLGAAADACLTRFDQLAQPAAWAEIDTS
ncbi:MAG: hypothetical protein ACK46Q_04555 [Hyphomonas sp.]